MIARPTSQRDQSLLLVSVVAFACLFAYWYLVHQPRGVAMAARRTHVEALVASNTQARAVLARGSADSLDRQQAALEAQLRAMRVLIPTGNEVPALLDQILAAARRDALELEDMAPVETVSGTTFDTYGFRLSLRGTHHEIGAVLTSIASLPRIIVPAHLTLAPATTPGRRDAPAGAQMLVVTFDVQTYVARGEEGSPPSEVAVPAEATGAGADEGAGSLPFPREVFAYESRGRRDPFASLLTSGVSRPLVADLRVTGILVDPVGANSVAMLRDLATGQLYRAKEGSVFGRVRVTAIRPREVVLVVEEFGNTRREVLMLKDPRKEQTP